jgi:hypothetical protein
MRTAGSESGLGKRTDGNIGTAPQADSTKIGARQEDQVIQVGACAPDLHQ